jgi:hypothetical protein
VTSPLTPKTDDEAHPSGRSLVPLAPRAQPDCGFGYSRPSAVFLAQLIGVAQGVPQARTRRRLGPADASAVYEAGAQQTAPASRVCASL